jgi:hypothetical protein
MAAEFLRLMCRDNITGSGKRLALFFVSSIALYAETSFAHGGNAFDTMTIE